MARVTLESVDAVRERTGASYHDCYQALRSAGGDVVGAIVRLEQGGSAGAILAEDEGLGDRVLQLLGEGWRTRVAVRRGPNTVVEIPAVIGLAGAALFPRAAAVGVLAALATRCALVLERAPASV